MDYFELLRYRKSTRKFRQDQIAQDNLTAVLAAANSAPVGSNLYKDIHLTVVQCRDALDKLSAAAVKRWEDKAKMKKIIGNTPDIELRQRVFDPFYGAPTVIFVSHRKQDLQPGIEFANVTCIAYSMHLAATCLGLGSVFIWGSLEAMREIPELDNTAVLNLPDDFEPLLGIAIGHPEQELKARDLKTDKLAINYL
ncbi:nitroreductase family protein [Desulfitobacterium chlororespirans]|uniref:Nitroreductase n=1 Tax=Desulfitobacterium chlororespirans DSM 11544 TaxID=1121395 RepID=A0A1M7TVR4_9FIRM|nr:nitroreductase family protein [Desulfitobacterium chlororespirans]SHN74780.1 Nitroreductase [Desulfitobacterium chlororespirans DSM 11544]